MAHDLEMPHGENETGIQLLAYTWEKKPVSLHTRQSDSTSERKLKGAKQMRERNRERELEELKHRREDGNFSKPFRTPDYNTPPLNGNELLVLKIMKQAHHGFDRNSCHLR